MAAIFYSPTSACPSECNCFGYNGEWIADCARKELVSVTYEDFDANTTEIHLQYNFLESLDGATFLNVPNLKHLYLQSNRISELPQNIFKSLTNLETLRLNGNRIRDIGTSMFEFQAKLKLLYIHNNDLRRIEEQAFSGLEPAVEQISVATNPNLESIHVDSLRNLGNLTMIDMSGSALKTLDPNLIRSQINTLEKVYTYDISTLICDRGLESYISFMNRHPAKVFGRATMVCGEPSYLKGRSVSVVDERHYTTAGECPVECTCISSGTSYIADCSSRGLTTARLVGFAPETTEIFLQNNSITTLTGNNFLHLHKLEYLHLHNSGISVVDLNAFTGATALKQLTLNNNNINNVLGVFDNLVSLEVLNLNGNQLTTIRRDAFPTMPNLVQFSANGNAIQTVMSGAFDSMVSLKYFGMAQNALDELPENIFANSANLYFVDISGNNFNFLPAIPSSVTMFEARDSDILSLTASSLANANNLQTLELSNNRIYHIEENAFDGAGKLLYLYLDHNGMESVEDSHFASARSLVILDLSYNSKLAYISDNAFSNQRDTLQRLYLNNCGLSTTNGKALGALRHPNLYVALSGNPWNCECELQYLSDVIRTSPSSFDNPTCQEPAWELGNSITEVDYLSACGEVVRTKAPEEPNEAAAVASDQSTLIISLTIVLAVIVFAVTMIVILLQSQPKKVPGSVYGLPSQAVPTYVNSEYEADEKSGKEYEADEKSGTEF